MRKPDASEPKVAPLRIKKVFADTWRLEPTKVKRVTKKDLRIATASIDREEKNSEDLMFPCTRCKKRFATSKRRSSHMYEYHPRNGDSQKMGMCKKCCMWFKYSALNKHIRKCN